MNGGFWDQFPDWVIVSVTIINALAAISVLIKLFVWVKRRVKR